jgi:hypothetical protein
MLRNCITMLHKCITIHSTQNKRNMWYYGIHKRRKYVYMERLILNIQNYATDHDAFEIMHITLQFLILCNKNFFRDTISEIGARPIRCRLRTHIEANCITTYPNKILMAVAPKASKTFGSTPVLRYHTVHPAVRRAHISTISSVSYRLWIVPCFYTWLL